MQDFAVLLLYRSRKILYDYLFLRTAGMILLELTFLIRRFSPFPDFLQIRHCAEDHHFHQEQPVSGSDPVRRWHDSSAR